MRDFDFFKTNKDLNPEKGDLLISEPFMMDGNFSRTVVLLCDHNDEGSFGFVINRKSNFVIDQVVDNVFSFDASIYVGGPVQQDAIHVIHRTESLSTSSNEVLTNVFWGGDFELIIQEINKGVIDKKDFRFFAGYSGWGAGQLMSEIKSDSWIIYKHTTAQLIFDLPPENLWKEVLNSLGGRYKMMSNYPSDPRLN